MNYNTFIHAVAGVNEVLHKQAAMSKQAGVKEQLGKAVDAVKGGAGKAWGAAKANPWVSIPAAGAAAGALGGGLYGGLSEDGSVPMGMLAGAAGGAGLAAGGLGAYRGYQNRALIADAMKKYFGSAALKGGTPWYMNPYLHLGAGGALAGGLAGGLVGGDLGSAAIGAGAGAGLGLGGAYGAHSLGKYNWLKGQGGPVSMRTVFNPMV